MLATSCVRTRTVRMVGAFPAGQENQHLRVFSVSINHCPTNNERIPCDQPAGGATRAVSIGLWQHHTASSSKADELTQPPSLTPGSLCRLATELESGAREGVG